jgi:hypothetical protein
VKKNEKNSFNNYFQFLFSLANAGFRSSSRKSHYQYALESAPAGDIALKASMAYVTKIRDKVEDKKELKASFKAAQRAYKDDYRANNAL